MFSSTGESAASFLGSAPRSDDGTGPTGGSAGVASVVEGSARASGGGDVMAAREASAEIRKTSTVSEVSLEPTSQYDN